MRRWTAKAASAALQRRYCTVAGRVNVVRSMFPEKVKQSRDVIRPKLSAAIHRDVSQPED